jgi:hypothetical protein
VGWSEQLDRRVFPSSLRDISVRMEDGGPTINLEETALDERLRQAEVRVTAQATYLTAAYQRSTVLAGIVFAIAAAVASSAGSDWVNPDYRAVLESISIMAFIPLVALVLTSAFTRASFPGAIDIAPESANAFGLKTELLRSYRISYKHNLRRIRAVGWAIASVALTFCLMSGTLAFRVYEVQRLREFIEQPALAQGAWDQQSWAVKRHFESHTPSASAVDRARTWNRLTQRQRRSFVFWEGVVKCSPGERDYPIISSARNVGLDGPSSDSTLPAANLVDGR